MDEEKRVGHIMADLLIELFSEEIPARMQAKASDDLKRMMTEALKAAGLTFEAAEAFATPRRLALHVTGLPTSTPDISEERRGPRADAPEQAVAGFLRGAGVAREDLVEREDKKGTFLYAVIEKQGRAAADVVAEALEHTIRNFPWPKSQRWGAGNLKWVRPLHSIICLLDGTVVDMDVDGYRAGDSTSGHRFMAPGVFAVTGFADYKQKLLDHKVILDPARRQTLIRDTAQTLASAAGLDLVEDAGLFAEVAGLVEWPVPMIGSFDANFLAVPEEVLILTMKKDQKYFVTRDPATGRLANKFIFTANIKPSDDGSAITSGNQRVLAARLADAQFFYQQDLKGKLEDNLPALEDIVFHKDLGTVAERVERIRKLAVHLAPIVGCDPDDADRAAQLCKADLVSGMVYEFPEVQGVMGRYYALEQGESDAVADAIRDHYAPLGPNDECPSAPVSIAVALAEKLDTLVGFFGINQKPTGSKDPFALRRAALGVIRLLSEKNLRLPLKVGLKKSAKFYKFQLRGKVDWKSVFPGHEGLGYDIERDGDDIVIYEGAEEIQRFRKEVPIEVARLIDFTMLHTAGLLPFVEFFGDRLKVQQRDKGVRHDLIDAVFAKGDDDLVRILNRVSALSKFLESDDGANLLAGYKRAANILKKADESSFGDPIERDDMEPSEKSLFEAMFDIGDIVNAALKAEDFKKAMIMLAALRAPIDTFFEEVMVNADDVDIRRNRMAMLSTFCRAVDRVADFSLIEG